MGGRSERNRLAWRKRDIVTKSVEAGIGLDGVASGSSIATKGDSLVPLKRYIMCLRSMK